jgi:hypothetical protein
LSIESLNEYPGPGCTANPEIDRFGQQILTPKSNYAVVSRSKRFENSGMMGMDIGNCIPGPASYPDIGKYILSRNKAKFNIKFAMGKRTTEFDAIVKKSREVPGAGTYRMPS